MLRSKLYDQLLQRSTSMYISLQDCILQSFLASSEQRGRPYTLSQHLQRDRPAAATRIFPYSAARPSRWQTIKTGNSGG
jgi:hypothetical protein